MCCECVCECECVCVCVRVCVRVCAVVRYGAVENLVALAGGDVIVVAVSYRLNALGFLSLSELSAQDPRGTSGNYGIMVCCWVFLVLSMFVCLRVRPRVILVRQAVNRAGCMLLLILVVLHSLPRVNIAPHESAGPAVCTAVGPEEHSCVWWRPVSSDGLWSIQVRIALGQCQRERRHELDCGRRLQAPIVFQRATTSVPATLPL